jgi:hypothetical protein
MKQDGALCPLLLNEVGLKLSGTHQLLVYAECMAKLLENDMNYTRKDKHRKF